MRKVLAICNLHDTPSLGALTESHPIGSTTFLGRYGIMDFTLSNFTNSGLNKVDILVEKNFQSIKNHVLDGNIWINNTKTGFQKIYFNEKLLHSPKFNTDIADITCNRICAKEQNAEYVLVAPVFFITRCDYREIIDAHIESKADITLMYTNVNDAGKRFLNCDKVSIKDGLINKFSTVKKNDTSESISLETYVFSKKVFDKLIEMAPNISSIFSLRDLVKYVCQNNIFKINSFEHKNYVLAILSLESYISESFSLLKMSNRKLLFDDSWPIYTTTHNTPPTLYGKNAEVKNCFIGNGTYIDGKVENCIISRDVIIHKNTNLTNCILFTGTEVGEGIKAVYVLTDKHAKLIEQKNLIGDSDDILFVNTGARI